MKLGVAQIGGFVSLLAVAVSAPAFAQSNGQSANDLRLPDTERDDPATGVRVDRDGGMKAPCPFEGSALKVNLNNVKFGAAGGGELSDKLVLEDPGAQAKVARLANDALASWGLRLSLHAGNVT
jgi:hypothetical protein